MPRRPWNTHIAVLRSILGRDDDGDDEGDDDDDDDRFAAVALPRGCPERPESSWPSDTDPEIEDPAKSTGRAAAQEFMSRETTRERSPDRSGTSRVRNSRTSRRSCSVVDGR